VGLVIRLVELLIVIVPLVGVIVAAIKGFSAITKQRGEQRDESGQPGPQPETLAGPAPRLVGSPAVLWQTITRVIEEHARTDERWLDYELDPARLLDFPLMTDMREPLTMRFHKAKLRADLLRPARAEALLDDRDSAEQYLAAVEDYVTAFDAAEAEAIRKRRTDFTLEAQQRIGRAQSLLRVASDGAATPQEREHAYQLARKELDGLLVLPAVTRKQIERGVAGEIDG
jgi:hypothetical protein